MASLVESACYTVSWLGCVVMTLSWRKEKQRADLWLGNALDCARTLNAAHRYANWLRQRVPAAEARSGQGLLLQRLYENHQKHLFSTGEAWPWDPVAGADVGGPDLAAVPVTLVFEAGKAAAFLLSQAWLSSDERKWVTTVRDELAEYL